MSTPTERATQYFSRYHAEYRKSAGHARGQDLSLLIDALGLKPESAVLDAACGPGHTALALAEQGHLVTGLDVTQDMLDEAKEFAAERQLTATWMLGDVHQLPFDDNTFSAVTCRRAAHHFLDLSTFLEEAHRVLGPQGRLGISDMTAPTSAITALNRLERIRDASHVGARTANEWVHLVASARFDVKFLEVAVESMLPEEWLSPVTPDSEPGATALARIKEPNFAPELINQGKFLKYRLILIAEKR